MKNIDILLNLGFGSIFFSWVISLFLGVSLLTVSIDQRIGRWDQVADTDDQHGLTQVKMSNIADIQESHLVVVNNIGYLTCVGIGLEIFKL